MTEHKIHFVKKSSNSKTGKIPVTYSERGTCPPSCPHYREDCYAEDFYTRLAWDKVPARGLPVESLCEKIRALPDGQLWRHNVAGDLPGAGESIDRAALAAIVEANKGRRGFTYTHKTRANHNLSIIESANDAGFTINLSADNLAHADMLADKSNAPIAAIVPMDHPEKSVTPKGRRVIVCPAQTRDNVTCESCGLCALSWRGFIVGFRAHGTKAKRADAIARGCTK